jgi:hypothetical protein
MRTNPTAQHAHNLRLLEGAIRVLQEEHKRLASEAISAKATVEAGRLFGGVAQALTLNGIAKRIPESEAFEAAMNRIRGQIPG